MAFEGLNKRLDKTKHRTKSRMRRIVFSGIWLTGLLLLIQLFVLYEFFLLIQQGYPYLVELLSLVSSLVMIYIINDKSNPAYKIAWIIPVMVLPVFGGVFYLFVKLNFGGQTSKGAVRRILDKTRKYAHTDERVKRELEGESAAFRKLADYLEMAGGYPAWTNTSVTYFPLGDKVPELLFRELEQAREYIFLEYFIIEEGSFWNGLLEILEEKAGEGLDVRLMYDDFGCVTLLPRKYHLQLKEKGIRVKKYARLTPFLSTHLNNRDHRKMVIIDGKAVFSGGMNLADEYINAYEKYGHWKDNGFLLKGDAVYNYTLMFLQMWNAVAVFGEEDFARYIAKRPLGRPRQGEGYVIPYGDGPHQLENVAKNVYMDILARSRDYVYVMTPYLILDYEIQQALEHAAKCGIDVRIIMPHVPDKRAVFYIGRTHYPQLLRAGVRIYEYLPGFVHSKMILADDKLAAVGTINLDFRSFYLHYECGSVLYKTEGLDEIKADFLSTFEKCMEMKLADYRRTPLHCRMIGRVLRVFGPLL